MPGNDSDSLVFSWDEIDSTAEYYICLHFADIGQKSNNREETVHLNGELWKPPFVPLYMNDYTLADQDTVTGQRILLTFNQTDKSLLPPIVNGVELYQVKALTQYLTDQDEGTINI